MWFEKYRWLFILATFVFLAASFYQKRNSTRWWDKWVLYGTTALSIVIVVYSLLYR